MKTSELIGPALDWAVAKCENDEPCKEGCRPAPYSRDWLFGGPIIEREGIRMHRSYTGAWWAGSEKEPQRPIKGPTPLIAAMRCYVASKLGQDVNIPEELL